MFINSSNTDDLSTSFTGADSKQQRVRNILLKISGMRPSDRELALGFLGALSGLRDSEIILEEE